MIKGTPFGVPFLIVRSYAIELIPLGICFLYEKNFIFQTLKHTSQTLKRTFQTLGYTLQALQHKIKKLMLSVSILPSRRYRT